MKNPSGTGLVMTLSGSIRNTHWFKSNWYEIHLKFILIYQLKNFIWTLYEWASGAITLQWHHNELDGVSNHQLHDCLLNCLYRHKSKKTSKLRLTWLVNSPHKWPVTQKMLPFHDLIIWIYYWGLIQYEDVILPVWVSHYKDKMVLWLSHLYNGNLYPGSY